MTDPRKISARAQEIRPFQVMELLARAKALEAAGRSVIHMEIGEPDFPTPEPMLKAGRDALRAGDIHYTPALGLSDLREAIAGYYATHYRVEIPPSRIMVTPGATGALLLAVGALVDPGDEVLLADPGYPCNRNFVRLMGGVPAAIPVEAQSQYALTADMVKARWSAPTAAVMLGSPANPTGAVLPRAALAAIAQEVKARGAALIVDEIYHGLTYGVESQTAAALPGDVFVINSFSKYFHMTGWRLGWLIAPERFVSAIDRLAQNIILAPSTVAQHAAMAAFHPETLEILEARRAEFQARRDFLLPALQSLGFDIPVVPQGAFYLYAGCGKLTRDSHRFAFDLLDKSAVAITPGTDFGEHLAASHVRFAYTRPVAVLAAGVERMRQFLGA